MSLKSLLVVAPVFLIAGILSQSVEVVAQQPKAYPVAFRKLSDGTPVDDEKSLAEQMAKMQLRIEELEFDLEKKLTVDKSGKGNESFEELTERIGDIEKSVLDNGESIADIDGQIPGFVVSGHKKPKMKFFGRIHLDWWAFPRAQPGIEAIEGGNPEDRVAFRRLRIGVSGDLNDNMFYKYEGEFAPGRNPSYRDAYIGFSNSPVFNTILIGNHKRPYGLDQLNSSNHNTFIERPFVNDAFNENNRRLGISSNGFNEEKTLNWRYGIWHHALTQEGSGFVSDHYQPEIAARLAFMPWYDETSGGRGYCHLAIAGSWAWPDGSTDGADNASRYRAFGESRHRQRWLDTGRILGVDTSNLFGLEGVFNVGSLQLTGEYMTVGVNRLDAIGENARFDGGYVQAAYMLTGEHMPWNRERGTLARMKPFENFFSVRDCDDNVKRGLGAWQVAARYSWADFTDQDIIGGQADAITLATTWYWNSYARMQVNYSFGEIDRPPLTDAGGEYDVVGVRFMVDF